MPKGIYIRTKYHIEINRNGHFGVNVGHIVSKETRKKIGLANSIALKGHKLSDETKRKISESNKGRIFSEEHKIKLRKSKPLITEEHRKNLSLSHIGINKGKNHYNWKGGISLINKSIRVGFEMKQWHSEILKKYWYRCFDCGEKRKDLEVDHILQLSKYPRLKAEILNGQVLCYFCHKQKTIFERTGRMILNSAMSF